MTEIEIKLQKGGQLPEYKTSGASCLDCFARVANLDGVNIPDGSRCLINLGFSIALPEGYEAVIRPRSGLTKRGVDVSLGTIDSDYRGEVMACLINNSGGAYTVHSGDRICQMKIQESKRFSWKPVSELPATERGSGGFGSTGIN